MIEDSSSSVGVITEIFMESAEGTDSKSFNSMREQAKNNPKEDNNSIDEHIDRKIPYSGLLVANSNLEWYKIYSSSAEDEQLIPQ